MGKKENILFILFLGLCACILLVNLGGWELKGADEPRYAQISREMMETGQYILPRGNGRAYPDKPPLLFWLIALASKPFGDVTAFSARLPSALAALGLLVVVYLFAGRLYDRQTGLLAAFILFCSKEFFDVCLTVHFDTLLCLWTTLALYLWYRGYETGEGTKKYYALAYCSMGLAVLTKGPVGAAVPLVTIVLFLIMKRETGKIRHMEPGRGAVIILGMPALWLIPACMLGGAEYTQNILFKQNFARVIDSFAHKEPFYYYLLQFPLDFLPWTLFIPGACIYFWKQRSKNNRILLPLVWIGGTFLLFSLVSGKRSFYLLPLFPAAVLIMAKFWGDVLRMKSSALGAALRRSLTIPCYTFFGGFTVAGFVIMAGLLGNMNFMQDLAPAKSAVFPVACLAVAGGASGILYIRKQTEIKKYLYAMGLFLMAASLVTVVSVFPAVKSRNSAKPFCDRVRALVGPQDRLLASFEADYFNYCLHRYPIPVLRDMDELEKILSSSEKTYYLAKEEDYMRAPEEFKDMVTVIEKGAVGHRMIYFLVNKTGVSEAP